MRLVVRQGGIVVNEFQCGRSPVYIGRHKDSQVFLPDRVVSRNHAVVYKTADGRWMIEDLDSANKTYLNNKVIKKNEIKSGDHVRIANFDIEINIDEDDNSAKKTGFEEIASKTAYSMEDTLTTAMAEDKQQIIVRSAIADHAPDITLPAKRAKDFMQATEAICKAKGPDEVLHVLLNIARKQFNASHTWCALRTQPKGDMTFGAGRQQDGSSIELKEIKHQDKIALAVEKNQFILMPRIPPAEDGKTLIRSAMIAPIVGQTGCFGVLYIDNDMAHEHYSLSDLDYLMLIAIHTAVVVENF